MDFLSAGNTIYFLSFILVAVISVLKGVEGDISTPNNVTVFVGENAEIPCDFDQSNLVALSWYRGVLTNDSSKQVVRYFRKRIFPGSDKRFNMSEDYSLLLSNAQLEDSSYYTCQVTIQGIFQSSTNLIVTEVKMPGNLGNGTVTTTQPTTAQRSTAKQTTWATTAPTSPEKSSQKTDVPQKSGSAAETPATQAMKTGKSEEPSKPTSAPAMISKMDNVPIIIGCSIGGLILLAILVLACYCYCCRNKNPSGYSKPKPV